MQKKMMLPLIAVFLFFSLGIIKTFAVPQDEGVTSKEVYEVTVHSKKVDEGFLHKHIYPLVPLITVIFAALTGGIINHIYWKRREKHAKKTNIFNEKMRCYVSLAKCLLEYNVCTDIMMSTSSDIEELKKQSNREEKDNQELKNLKQIYRDYQKKRIEPFAKIRQELSNAEVFF